MNNSEILERVIALANGYNITNNQKEMIILDERITPYNSEKVELTTKLFKGDFLEIKEDTIITNDTKSILIAKEHNATKILASLVLRRSSFQDKVESGEIQLP